MKLVSPTGVRISVSDERGAALKRYGYKEVGDAVNASPASAPARKTADSEAAAEDRPVKRRTTRTKTTKSDDSADE